MMVTASAANGRKFFTNGIAMSSRTACIIFGFHDVCSDMALAKTVLVTKSAVNIDAAMPATSVTANPRIRPVPTTNRITPVRTVVRLPSKIALNARW